MDVPVANEVVLFEGFRLDRRGGGLFRQDASGGLAPLAVRPRALDVLAVLIAHQGELVSKHAIMRSVWPGVAVEEKNLTVHISALRRVLDNERGEQSCIQTEAGRGYRFVAMVTRPNGDEVAGPPQVPLALNAIAAGASVTDPDMTERTTPLTPTRRRPRTLELTAVVTLLLVIGFGAAWWLNVDQSVPDREVQHAPVAGPPEAGQVPAPRLSLVVLPFQNLSGVANEDYLVDAVTDDLTTDLSHIPEAFVIANASARAYKGKAVDVRQIGRELGVRYVVEGSARLAGTALHVNVQLISTETGAHVWSDMFDEPIKDLASGQGAVLARMRGTLGISLIETEIARGRRVPQASPDAFDLILRARALRNQPRNRERFDAALSLYEQALRLDPSSILALTGAAAMLLENRGSRLDWSTRTDLMRRTEALVTRAREIAPASEEVLGVHAFWLHVENGCRKSMPAARYMVETFPNPRYGYAMLSDCLIITGRSEEVIPLMEKAIRLNPRDTFIANRLHIIGSAHLFLGHYEEAIRWLERALAADPDARDTFNAGTRRKLAAAYAHIGKAAEARRALAAADKDWPFDTVRGHFPDDFNPVFASQVRNYQDGLRRAGERDHAEEDADFGISADATLRSDLVGNTPTTTPAAPTIRTAELPAFIAERKPVIIDPMMYFWGRSIPGAVGLKDAGVGGTTIDGAQDRLGRKMTELTGGDLNRSIVALGWNSERFDGRNLALRLVALGYTNVSWYRGGREAWEVAGMPEDVVRPADW